MLALLSLLYSCEKKEPAVKLAPGELVKKIAEQFPEYNRGADYESGNKSKELPESKATELYSDGKNNPADMSKIEKYVILVMQPGENPAEETGIFKLYDKVNADYVKQMAQARILKMQDYGNLISDTGIAAILNDAEIRSYGEYVYYVSHPQKDKIFEIIEKSLRGE